MRVDCFTDAPADWPRMTVGQIAEVNPRYKLDKNTEYPFIEMAAVAESFGGITRLDSRKAEASGLARFKVNDILFGKITPCAENGKVALGKDLPEDFGLGSTEFIVLSPRQGYAPRFVYSLVCSNPVLGRAISRMEGSTGRLRVTEDTFTRWLTVAVPPMAERECIAQALEAVDTVIDRTRTAIEKARRLRQGLIEEQFRAMRTRVFKLGEFITDIRYGTSQASNENHWGYPTLRIPNIIGGTVNTTDLTCVDAPPRDADRFNLKDGDLLLVRTNGNPGYIGRSAVFEIPDNKRWLFASYLIRVRFDDRVARRFVDEYLKIGSGRRELLRRVTTSAGNHNINARSIMAIPIGVPDSKDAQENLVRLADATNRRIAASEKQLGILERLKRGLMQDLLSGRVRVTGNMGAGQQPKATSEALA